ncbi:MAG: AraC family transcriptional regulator [Maribacter sp.]|uniref:helix-turn-helix domain-containing protein n=1 Tax=Maribacter sp. TaxID=1897614 RepID=UPI003299760B
MENKIVFISSLGKITFFLMIVFSVFLCTVKSTKRSSNRILGFMLLLVAFDLSGFFIGGWFEEHLSLNSLKTASSLLQMPVFLFYVLSVCFSNFRFRPVHLLHIVLFVAFFTLFKITSLSSASFRLYAVFGELQWFAYMIAVFVSLDRYKRIQLENNSQANSKAYQWLFQFTVLSCVAHGFVLLKSCLQYVGLDHLVLDVNSIISISTLAITTWFVLKALYHPQLFTGVETNLRTVKSSLRKGDSGLNHKLLKAEIERLQAFMINEKPYLDFELTLQKLATQFDTPDKELSILINHHMGKHFFDFVNEYRIEEAKTILINPDEKDQTILEVLYQVGFNSKSSFYTAFKKLTGKTPTVFRKERLSL